MEKTNRRAQRTRQRLHDALTELIHQKPYDQIAVQDIAEHAELSRATFYLHYQDKDGLFSELMEQHVDALIACFQDDNDRRMILSDQPFKAVFRCVEAQHRLYRILLTEQGGAAAMPVVRARLALGLETRLRRLATGEIELTMDVPLGLVCGFTANALLGMISWWIEHELIVSADYMAQLSRQMNLFGIMPFVMGAKGPTWEPNDIDLSKDTLSQTVNGE